MRRCFIKTGDVLIHDRRQQDSLASWNNKMGRNGLFKTFYSFLVPTPRLLNWGGLIMLWVCITASMVNNSGTDVVEANKNVSIKKIEKRDDRTFSE